MPLCPFTVDFTQLPLGLFHEHTHGVLKLPGLLDDEGPGWVGLLHRRTNLAVPHAHGRLWEVVAQLQTHKGKEIISFCIRFPESLHLIRFTQWDIKATQLHFCQEGCICSPCQLFLWEEYPLAASCWWHRGSGCNRRKKVSQNGKCIDPFVPIAVVGPSHFGISSAIKVYIVFCEEESILSSLKGLVAILPPGGDKLDFIPTLVYQTSCHPSRGSRGLHPPPRFFWPPVFLQPSLLTQGRNKQLGFNSPLMYMLHEASLYWFSVEHFKLIP